MATLAVALSIRVDVESDRSGPEAALFKWAIMIAVWIVVLAMPIAGGAQAPTDLECSGVQATVVGTSGHDILVGTDGRDVIVALGGNDRIEAGGGDDLICAGPDSLADGQTDDDIIVGGDGNDAAYAGLGDDVLKLGDGDDYAEGADGNDILAGGAGSDYLDTAAGLDRLDGGPGDDYLAGGEGRDVLDGGPDTDYLDAGGGDDFLVSTGGGADYLDGGPGDDRIEGQPDTSYIDGNDGNDRIDAPAGYVAGGAGHDLITAGQDVGYVEAGEGDDYVHADAPYVEGGDGADHLTGGPVAGQVLDGGEGIDALTLRGSAGGVALGGSEDDQLQGASGPDVLVGGDGHDTLRGSGGPDVLDGGYGDDTLIGGPGSDSFLGGFGRDRVRAADGDTDQEFDCGPVFADDVLVVDSVEDADVERINCEVERPPRSRPDPVPDPPDPQFDMVALGDSYSSGEGTYAYGDGPGDAVCHRGVLAWPARLARDGDYDSFRSRACTGAETIQLIGPYPSKGQTAQLEPVVDFRVELVTITIGGNDLGFGDLVTRMRASHGDKGGPGPLGSPAANEAKTQREIDAGLRKLSSDLRTRYRDIRDRFPLARIVHVGYPAITPAPGVAPYRCGWLGAREQIIADQIVRQLNTTIAQASASSQQNIGYVDVYPALRDHELCTRDPWMIDIALAGASERGHPNIRGQRAIADAVRGAL